MISAVKNVGGKHIDSENARNPRFNLDPSLTIADAGIVNYRIEAAKRVDLLGDGRRSVDCREITADDRDSAGRSREAIATSSRVPSVQYDPMAPLDQQSGRHQTETIRRSRYEYTCQPAPLVRHHHL